MRLITVRYLGHFICVDGYREQFFLYTGQSDEGRHRDLLQTDGSDFLYSSQHIVIVNINNAFYSRLNTGNSQQKTGYFQECLAEFPSLLSTNCFVSP
jgi:hypothetical protein